MEQAALIVPVVWLAVLSPGADFAMVSRNSCLYGRQAGLAVSTGIAIACWFHVAYAIAGIALIERTLPHAFGLIRMLGAAYLIYMGVSMVLRRRAAEPDAAGPPAAFSTRGVVTGLLTNGLNPKTSIFVISIYSQALGPDAPLRQQIAWGLFISLSHLAWFALVSSYLSKPGVRAFVLRRQILFNRAIGVVLTLFGTMLLYVNQPGGML